MAITRGGTRTGVDVDRCPICDCNRPDPLDPEAYSCMWAVTRNVRDCSEHEDPEVVWQEQRDYASNFDNGFAAGWLTRRMQCVVDGSGSSDEGSEEQ